ncbi:MAG: hypothetical protein C4529_07790 [Deltaproteobacteria bacterium]|nr:MAG: hypothetical protein C4529_07790 [Deltaproteobacteria bacterium]
MSTDVEQEGIDMKKPGKTCSKAGSKPPDIIRHSTKLRPEETRDIVERLADLIVDFVKMEGVDSVKGRTQIHASTERSIPEPLRDGRTGKKKKRK